MAGKPRIPRLSSGRVAFSDLIGVALELAVNPPAWRFSCDRVPLNCSGESRYHECISAPNAATLQLHIVLTARCFGRIDI